VYATLADVEGYQSWWPQVRKIDRLDDDSCRVSIRSLLPYTLELVLIRAEQDQQRRVLRVNIEGDLQGWCAWNFTDHGNGTRASFSQEVEVTVPMLNRTPVAMRPLLRGNHALMMRSGERGLRRQLAC
jgi:hypothetical protein